MIVKKYKFEVPEISVIMPTYNNAVFLSEAIESMLNQTYGNFEMLIINDGSYDNTLNVIMSYKDSRISTISNSKNMGIAYSLNLGIANSKGRYIARMDSDDVSEINRFEEQISYMKNNPDIDICGTQIRCFDENGSLGKTIKKRSSDEEICRGLFWGESSMAHPSIMIRHSSVKKHDIKYNVANKYSEDYELYCKYSTRLKYGNIPKPLHRYRIHSNSVSISYSDMQRMEARRVLYKHLKNTYNMIFTEEEFITHCSYRLPMESDQIISIERRYSWVEYLLDWNRKEHVFNEIAFEEEAKKIIY
jgi:glycosyltransferase involved in cell wall biosynthesis